MEDLSVIIVTYNSENYIKQCLKSIIENTKYITYNIQVVDNDSKDKTVEIVEELMSENQCISLIRTENKGFNAGNNLGIKNSNSKYIVLLNPDTILLNNAFKIVIDGMEEDKKIGSSGACLYTEEGGLNFSSGSFPSLYDTIVRSLKLRKDNYYLADLSKKKMEVEFPIGADFFFRREMIDKIGYLDEMYFLYFDETDFARRISNLGFKSYLFTQAKIVHLQGKSTENVSEFAKVQFLESYIKYLNKNLSKFESILISLFKIIEHILKLIIISPFKNQHMRRYKMYKEELKFYSTVLRNIKVN